MKKYGTLALGALFGVILDCTVFVQWNFWGARPWMLLSVALAAVVSYDVQSGIVVALLGGLAIDAVTNSYLGLTAACYLLSVSVLWKLIEKNHPKSFVLWLFGSLVTAMHAPILWLYSYLSGAHFHGIETTLFVMLPSAVLTGLCVLPVQRLLDWAKKTHRDRI